MARRPEIPSLEIHQMSMPTTLQIEWWRWWSNPLIQLNDDHHHRMPYPPDQSQKLSVDYFQLLQTRSVFELEDQPDQELLQFPEYIAVSVTSIEQQQQHLLKLSALTLDTTIIHSRPQEWEQKFNVKSADDIRKIIEHYRSIPPRLHRWQFQSASLVNQNDNLIIPIQIRLKIGLGMVLKGFFPSFFKRWSLNVSDHVLRFVNMTEPMEQSMWNEVHEWMGKEMKALFEEVCQQHGESDIDIELDTDLFTEEESYAVDVDQLYGGSNA